MHGTVLDKATICIKKLRKYKYIFQKRSFFLALMRIFEKRRGSISSQLITCYPLFRV